MDTRTAQSGAVPHDNVVGGDALVQRRWAVKRAAGCYDDTPLGAALRSGLRSALRRTIPELAVRRIDRPARRPAPRQLVTFEILHHAWPDDGPSPGVLACRAFSALADLDLVVAIVPAGAGRVTVESRVPGVLRHSLATAASCDGGGVELSIGVDCLLVVLALAHPDCPPSIGRPVPVYLGRGASAPGTTDVLLDIRPTSEMPAEIVRPCILISGRTGIHVLSRCGRRRVADMAEALSLWCALDPQ